MAHTFANLLTHLIFTTKARRTTSRTICGTFGNKPILSPATAGWLVLLGTTNPRLTPWAKLLRPSGAERASLKGNAQLAAPAGKSRRSPRNCYAPPGHQERQKLEVRRDARFARCYSTFRLHGAP